VGGDFLVQISSTIEGFVFFDNKQMDEFSEFQMAVGPHHHGSSASMSKNGSGVGVGGGGGLVGTGKGLWVLEQSPIMHTTSSTSNSTSTSLYRSQSQNQHYNNHHYRVPISSTSTGSYSQSTSTGGAGGLGGTDEFNRGTNNIHFTMPLMNQHMAPPLQNLGGPQMAPHPDKHSVGSRLANYNLGMKRESTNNVSTSMSLENQRNVLNQSWNSFETVASLGSNQKLSSTVSSAAGPSLLMGEEDKYAALRVLVSSDAGDEPGRIQAGNVHEEEGYFQAHKTSAESSSVLQNVESDFGDFQSFSYCDNVQKNSKRDSFDALRQNSDIVDSMKRVQIGNGSSQGSSWHPGFVLENACSINQEMHSSVLDADFGDFVSVSQQPDVIVTKPIVSTSKDLAVDDSFKDLLWNPVEVTPSNSGLDWMTDLNSSNQLPRISKQSDASESVASIPSNFSNSGTSMKVPLHVSNMNFLDSINGMEDVSTDFLKVRIKAKDSADGSEVSGGCAALSEINNDSIDFNYSGQKDLFSSCVNARNTSLDISPESRSIASLDLGNYCTASENCDIGKSPERLFLYGTDEDTEKDHGLVLRGASIGSTKIAKQYDFTKSDDSLHSTVNKDKYQCFKDEVDTVNKLI
jgi:hypothetical protein